MLSGQFQTKFDIIWQIFIHKALKKTFIKKDLIFKHKNAERMDKCYIAICADYDDHGKWVELVSR